MAMGRGAGDPLDACGALAVSGIGCKWSAFATARVLYALGMEGPEDIIDMGESPLTAQMRILTQARIVLGAAQNAPHAVRCK